MGGAVMSETILNATLSVITALLAAGLLHYGQQRRKLRVEAQKTEVDTAAQLSNMALLILAEARKDAELARTEAMAFRAEALSAREEMATLREEIKSLRLELAYSHEYMRRHGILPPTPDEVRAAAAGEGY